MIRSEGVVLIARLGPGDRVCELCKQPLALDAEESAALDSPALSRRGVRGVRCGDGREASASMTLPRAVRSGDAGRLELESCGSGRRSYSSELTAAIVATPHGGSVEVEGWVSVRADRGAERKAA